MTALRRCHNCGWVGALVDALSARILALTIKSCPVCGSLRLVMMTNKEIMTNKLAKRRVPRRVSAKITEPTEVSQSHFSYKEVVRDDWKGEKYGVVRSYIVLEKGEALGITCTTKDVAIRLVEALTHQLALITLAIMKEQVDQDEED